MKGKFLLLFFIFCLRLPAQVYTVGTQTITYTDPARSNRSVGVEFRYPGTNVAVANGQFPFVIFAHGFQMDQTPYYPYSDSLAKQGYIVGLLTTETSLSPSHANFAQDLIFVYNKLISESSTNNASPFYQKVIPKGAIGGHSMGGGSTVLSAQYGNPATCYFTFAAAVTNPSSVIAAPLMTKPYLSFAGSRDCIAPIATHQQPMFDSSGSPCKFLINILDGLHCQFGLGNFQCNFGEGFSGCAASPLSRSSQINKTLDYLVPFLNYYLKGNCAAWTLFESRYSSNTTDALQRNCTNSIPVNPSITGNNFFCTGSSTTLTATPAGFSYTWSDNSTSDTLSVSMAGNYSLTISNGVCLLASPPVSVTENFPPSTPSAITASDTVCSGISNINIAVASDAAATSYNWVLPNGWNVTSGASTNSITVTSGINGGTISVTAENSCGPSFASTKTIFVIPSNLGTPGVISGEDTVCSGVLQTYSVLPVNGAASYVWSFPAGWNIVSGGNSNSVSVSTGNSTGNISLSAQNNCGQSTPSQFNVVVRTIETLVSITGPDTICIDGGNGIYYGLEPPVFSEVDFHWSVPNDWSFIGSSNSSAPILNVNSSGTINAYISNVCGNSNTITLNITVVDTPHAQISVNGNVLSASPSDSAFQYFWYLNGTQIPNANSETYPASQSGAYVVYISDSNGCDSYAEINFTFLGTSELQSAEGLVSPNPFNEKFQLQVNENLVGSEMKIFNAEGKLVVSSFICHPLTSVSISSFSSGVYFLQVSSDKKTWRTKLMKE